MQRGNAEQFFSPTGVLRIPRDSSQAATYRERHQEFPEVTEWLAGNAVHERYPALSAPHGALFVRAGGYVRVPGAIRQLLAEAQHQEAHLLTSALVTSWGTDEGNPYVTIDHHTRIYAQQLILAVGSGYERFDELRTLGLRGVKGQTVTVERPSDLHRLPSTSGYGYIAPDTDRLVLGSSYEHQFSDAEPSREQSLAIIDKVSRMMPGLADASIVDERAGTRVMAPQSNQAVVGPLPGHENIWCFGGLGSKGLLMAPLAARRLSAWLNEPRTIPERLRPDSTRTTQ
jgi:glycine/D-amino acid oxidase-like deaminating enzyme